VGGTDEIVPKPTQRGKRAQNDYNQIYAAAEKQRKMLNGLRRSLSET
jgi:predicted amidophosphoribosyltransferase